MTRRLALIVTLCAAFSANAQYARTLTERGDPLFWNNRCFHYRIGAQGSPNTPERTEDAAIEASFATWRRVSDACGSGWRFFRDADVPVSQYRIGYERGQPNDNVIVWRTTHCRDVVPVDHPCRADPDTAHVVCANEFQCFYENDDGVIALTSSTYNTRSGLVYKVDVEFNATPKRGLSAVDALPNLFTTVDSPVCSSPLEANSECVATDIQNTMTHEIGHVLGLAHVTPSESTMYESADFGELSKRVIDPGSAQGLCETSPPGPLACDEADTLEQPIDVNDAAMGVLSCATAPSSMVAAVALLVAARLLRRRASQCGEPTRVSAQR